MMDGDWSGVLRLPARWKRPSFGHMLLFYAAYVLAGGFGQGLALIPGVSIIFWPPVGILIATLLSCRLSSWLWWIGVGCLAEITCNGVWFHNPLPYALIYYAGNALEGVIGAFLIRRWFPSSFQLASLEEVIAFVLLAAGAAPIASATMIGITDAMRGKHPFIVAWPLVWLGDSTGLLVSAPLTLVAIQAWRQRRNIPPQKMWECGILGLLLIGIGILSLRGRLPSIYLTMPVLLWTAARFQVRGAAVGMGIVTLVTAGFTILREGDISGLPHHLKHEKVVMLQCFLGISAASALIVGAISQLYRNALCELNAVNAYLEARVAERTASLQASESRLRTYFEHAPAAIAMFDRDMRYLHANRRWHADYKLGDGKLVGLSHYDLFPNIPEQWKEAHQRALQGEVVGSEEDRFDHHDGSAQWIQWEIRPWTTASGDIGGTIIFSEDLTARKQAEQETEYVNRTLGTIIEQCPFGIYIVDADFRIASVNTGSITGAFASVRPIIGRPFDEVMRIIWPEPVANDCINIFRRTLETGETYFSKDFVNRRADIDQTEGYEWEVHRIMLADGRFGVVCYYFDSTKLRRVERDLRETEGRLREADQKKNVFLATLAHELRNPLAPIRNGLQVMELAKDDPEQVDMAHAMMVRQVEQMTRLIDDLMDLSRVSQGKIVLQKSKMLLADAVRNAVDTSRPLMNARRHQLVVNMPREQIHVEGDLTRLSQVFTNLLNNAAKYTEPGGHIRLTVEKQEGDVIITVEDNGIGIEPRSLNRVFDMFAQVDHSLENSQGGLGVGLNIVQRLVEMHEGDIHAMSDGLGQGSRFIVRLPIPQSFNESIELVDCNKSPACAMRRRVLVVDDNVDGAKSLAMMLKLKGNETQIAYDGQEAVSLAEAFRPDAIFMDIGLPKINGYDACRRIQREPWGKDIMMIALTGWGQEDDKQKTRDAGFHYHLVKPADFNVVQRLVASIGTGALA